MANKLRRGIYSCLLLLSPLFLSFSRISSLFSLLLIFVREIWCTYISSSSSRAHFYPLSPDIESRGVRLYSLEPVDFHVPAIRINLCIPSPREDVAGISARKLAHSPSPSPRSHTFDNIDCIPRLVRFSSTHHPHIFEWKAANNAILRKDGKISSGSGLFNGSKVHTS